MMTSQLNSREVEFVRLICHQYNLKEIAVISELKLKEAKKYRREIIEKIGAKNEVGILVYAIKTGIIKI